MQAGANDVGPQHVHEWDGMHHGLDPIQVQLLNIAEMIEHSSELVGIGLDLIR